MTTPDDIAQRHLGFDPATFREERGTALDTAELALLDEDFHGIACRAPATVSPSEGQLPVVMALRSTGHRAWQVPRDANVQLLLAHLPSRQLWVGQPFHDAKLDEYPLPEDELVSPQEPTGTDAESIVVDVQRVDAVAMLGGHPRPGPLRVAFVMFDTASNLGDLTLEGDSAPASGWPVRPAPGTYGLQTFAPQPAPAEPTTRPGLTVEVLAGGRMVGRLMVDPEPIHILDVPMTLDEGDGMLRNVWATIPLTLLAVVPSGGPAWRLDLGVPVFGSGPTAPGHPLDGAFALDSNMAWGALPEGSMVWAWLEGQLLGPWRLT